MSRVPEDIHAELAALADGTLLEQQRERLLTLLADSPELSAELEGQRRAVAIVRSLESVEAPSLLRRAIETMTAGESPPAGARSGAVPRWRRQMKAPGRPHSRPLPPRLGAAAALAAAAAVALILALTTTGGGASAPTVLQASSLGLRSATGAAPAESRSDPHLLAASAAGIDYPYWGGRLGWRAAGVRGDSLGGRTITTVFYTDSRARRIGYSIVSGGVLPVPAGSTVVQRHGVSFHVVRSANPTVLTWREGGHTCILTARDVAPKTLVRLAAWERV